MALKTAKLCFDVEYDGLATTPTKLARTLDQLFDEVLRGGELLEDHASDTHGTPGVGPVRVDKSEQCMAATRELLATGDVGFDGRMTVDAVLFDELSLLLDPPKKRNKRKPKT